MSEPGAIGCDKAELDALKNQIVVDTAIIKALRYDIQVLEDAQQQQADDDESV